MSTIDNERRRRQAEQAAASTQKQPIPEGYEDADEGIRLIEVKLERLKAVAPDLLAALPAAATERDIDAALALAESRTRMLTGAGAHATPGADALVIRVTGQPRTELVILSGGRTFVFHENALIKRVLEGVSQVLAAASSGAPAAARQATPAPAVSPISLNFQVTMPPVPPAQIIAAAPSPLPDVFKMVVTEMPARPSVVQEIERDKAGNITRTLTREVPPEVRHELPPLPAPSE